MIKDSGERTTFDTGANRDMSKGKGRLDLLPCSAILALARHCEAGALKYGERNVDKGIPQHSFIDSCLRHLFKYLRGDRDEDHLVAAFWNIAWALEQEERKPEMQDIPARLRAEAEIQEGVLKTMMPLTVEEYLDLANKLAGEGETDHD